MLRIRIEPNLQLYQNPHDLRLLESSAGVWPASVRFSLAGETPALLSRLPKSIERRLLALDCGSDSLNLKIQSVVVFGARLPLQTQKQLSRGTSFDPPVKKLFLRCRGQSYQDYALVIKTKKEITKPYWGEV